MAMLSESKYLCRFCQLQRTNPFSRLKSRHMQFIALGTICSPPCETHNLTAQPGGSIGTSLFLGIGSSLAQAGPLSLVLGFTISGLAVYGMMLSLGEMATWLPIPGAIPQFCSRFVDGALGFAVGWNVRNSDPSIL